MTWREARLLADPRVRVVVAVPLLVAFVYAWPAIGGALGTEAVDLALRVVAVLVVSTLAARRVSAAENGEAASWTAVVVATQVLAPLWIVQLLALGTDVSPPSQTLKTVAHTTVAALLAAALYGLSTTRATASARRVVEAGALWCAGVLVVWLAVQLTGLPDDAGARVTLVAAAVLAGAGAHAVLQRDAGWTALGVGALVVAAALVQEAAGGEQLWVGATWCVGLALIAVAAAVGRLVPGSVGVDVARFAPYGLLAVAPVLAVSGLIRPDDVVATEIALAVLVALLVLIAVRQQLLVIEHRSEMLTLAQERSSLEHRAFHDDLTELANRALFLDRLEHALALHRRHRRPLTVLFGDLDGFKAVNDRYGHHVGNEVLRAVAERLSGCMRPSDTVARLSGDEFAVLLEDDADALAVVARVQAIMNEPLRVGEHEVDVTMSIGTASVGAADPTPAAADLLRQADERMFERKRMRARGREHLVMPTAPRLSLSLREALPGALESGQISVVYQPLVDPVTGAVEGLEALARWRHDGVHVAPPVFVGVARELGLLGRLTLLVAEDACTQLRRWGKALGHDRLSVAVNIEPDQLEDVALHAELGALRRRYGLRAGQLVLEVAADDVLHDPTLVERASRTLAEQGTPLSLSHLHEPGIAVLHRLSLAAVKVNRGEPGDDAGQERLLRALKGVGRELDVGVVVEGVDRSEELTVLRRLGGVLAQGFAVARPSTAADMDGVLATGVPTVEER
ncbi:MAG: diguanylate cyclase domain-containing protein [Actinomycetes bacterium]